MYNHYFAKQHIRRTDLKSHFDEKIGIIIMTKSGWGKLLLSNRIGIFKFVQHNFLLQ